MNQALSVSFGLVLSVMLFSSSPSIAGEPFKGGAPENVADVLAFDEFLELTPSQQETYLLGLRDILFQVADDQVIYPFVGTEISMNINLRYPALSAWFLAHPFQASAKTNGESKETKTAREELARAQRDLQQATSDQDQYMKNGREVPEDVERKLREAEQNVGNKQRALAKILNATPGKTEINPGGEVWKDPVTLAEASIKAAQARRDSDLATLKDLESKAKESPSFAEERDKFKRQYQMRERLGCYVGRQDGRGGTDPRCEFGSYENNNGVVSFIDHCGHKKEMKACESPDEKSRKNAILHVASSGRAGRESPVCTTGLLPSDCKAIMKESLLGKCSEGQFACNPWTFGAVKSETGAFSTICIANESTVPGRKGQTRNRMELCLDESERVKRSFGFIDIAHSQLESTYDQSFRRIFNGLCGTKTAITARCELCSSLLPRLSTLNSKVGSKHGCKSSAKGRKHRVRKSNGAPH
jgi:hypothetical protein